MTDEQLAQAKTPILHFPTVLGAVVATYNLPGVEQARAHARGAGRHLPRQDHEVERPAHRQGESRGQLPAAADRPGPPLRRQRHHVRLHRLPREGEPGVGEDGRARHVGQLAGRPRRQGQRGRHRPGQADAELHRLRRARLRVQNKLAVRRHPQPRRQVRRADASRASRRPPRRRRRTCRRTSASRSPTPPAPDAYPISSFTWLLIPTRIADTDKGEAIEQFLGWMLSDGQAMHDAARLCAAAGRRGRDGATSDRPIVVGGRRHGARRVTALRPAAPARSRTAAAGEPVAAAAPPRRRRADRGAPAAAPDGATAVARRRRRVPRPRFAFALSVLAITAHGRRACSGRSRRRRARRSAGLPLDLASGIRSHSASARCPSSTARSSRSLIALVDRRPARPRGRDLPRRAAPRAHRGPGSRS